jgi:hypothetical protein
MGRPQLVALPGRADRAPDVLFCGHCGERAESAAPETRVCGHCELGLLVGASPGIAPVAGEPFLLVDGTLSVCAVSRAAEDMLLITEGHSVNRHIAEVLVPADVEVGGPGGLVNLLIAAARGDGEEHRVVVRPTREFGIRFWARIGPCGPPRAALLVLDDTRF